MMQLIRRRQSLEKGMIVLHLFTNDADYFWGTAKATLKVLQAGIPQQTHDSQPCA